MRGDREGGREGGRGEDDEGVHERGHRRRGGDKQREMNTIRRGGKKEGRGGREGGRGGERYRSKVS
jgi:hypothetical protein